MFGNQEKNSLSKTNCFSFFICLFICLFSQSSQSFFSGPVILKKVVQDEGSLSYPSYPGRVNVLYISLQNLTNSLHAKQKVCSARSGSPFCTSFSNRTSETLPSGLIQSTLLYLVSLKPREHFPSTRNFFASQVTFYRDFNKTSVFRYSYFFEGSKK